MLAISALLGEHVTGPYEGQSKPPLEVVVVTRLMKLKNTRDSRRNTRKR